MGASMDYLFGYDATTNLVPDWCYSGIYSVWLKDESNFNFLIDNNPWVMKDISERLLEASNRNLWESASTECIEDIKKIINYSESLIEGSENN